MFFLLLVLPRITAGSFIMFLASPRAHFVFSTGIRLRYRLATACGAVEARISALANLATTSSTKSRYRSALSKFRHICMPGGGPFSQQELATALSSESLVALFIGTQAEHRYSNETVRVDLTVATLPRGWTWSTTRSIFLTLRRTIVTRVQKLVTPTPETTSRHTQLAPQGGECSFLPALGQFSSRRVGN